jgi:hypothetical protein
MVLDFDATADIDRAKAILNAKYRGKFCDRFIGTLVGDHRFRLSALRSKIS